MLQPAQLRMRSERGGRQRGGLHGNQQRKLIRGEGMRHDNREGPATAFQSKGRSRPRPEFGSEAEAPPDQAPPACAKPSVRYCRKRRSMRQRAKGKKTERGASAPGGHGWRGKACSLSSRGSGRVRVEKRDGSPWPLSDSARMGRNARSTLAATAWRALVVTRAAERGARALLNFHGRWRSSSIAARHAPPWDVSASEPLRRSTKPRMSRSVQSWRCGEEARPGGGRCPPRARRRMSIWQSVRACGRVIHRGAEPARWEPSLMLRLTRRPPTAPPGAAGGFELRGHAVPPGGRAPECPVEAGGQKAFAGQPFQVTLESGVRRDGRAGHEQELQLSGGQQNSHCLPTLAGAPAVRRLEQRPFKGASRSRVRAKAAPRPLRRDASCSLAHVGAIRLALDRARRQVDFDRGIFRVASFASAAALRAGARHASASEILLPRVVLESEPPWPRRARRSGGGRHAAKRVRQPRG